MSTFTQNVGDFGGTELILQQIWCPIFIFYYCHGILVALQSTAEP